MNEKSTEFTIFIFNGLFNRILLDKKLMELNILAIQRILWTLLSNHLLELDIMMQQLKLNHENFYFL